jgi:hypothetical protein
MDQKVQISALKTDYWHTQIENKIKPVYHYDTELDTLFVYFSSRETDRIIVHFVDQNVAFLYRFSDKEIIGMRIEEFESEFLPNPPITKVWKLSDSGVKLDGLCDFIFAVEKEKVSSKTKRPIEREVKALEPVFG